MKFIKTKYEENKEIIRVNFGGGDAYKSFIAEGEQEKCGEM